MFAMSINTRKLLLSHFVALYLCKFGGNFSTVSNELQREQTYSRQLNSVANNSQLAVLLLNEGSRTRCLG